MGRAVAGIVSSAMMYSETRSMGQHRDQAVSDPISMGRNAEAILGARDSGRLTRVASQAGPSSQCIPITDGPYENVASISLAFADGPKLRKI